MKTALYAAAAALAAVAMAPAANATAFVVPMSASGNTWTADYGNDGLSGVFTDTFTFTPAIGASTGDVSFIQIGLGVFAMTLTSLDLDGIDLMPFLTVLPGGTFGGTIGLPLGPGTHVLTVSGDADGNASYAGTVNFTVPVPEPATWAMMLAGVAAVGMTMRRRSQTARVAFS